MKTKVNKQWYNQRLTSLKKAIKDEQDLIKMQYNRFFNYPTEFDSLHKISKEKVFTYLKKSVSSLGSADKEMKIFVNKYTPDDLIKIDWVEIEKHISKNAKKINQTKIDYYEFASQFFFNAKWGVTINSKNEKRLYNLMNKYCKDF